MTRMLVAVTVAGLALTGVLGAQGRGAAAPAPLAGAAPPSAVTVGFMHAIHATGEVEKTLAFYRDVFGVNGRVSDFANTAVPILTNSPGVTLKVAMLNLAPPARGFNFELTQFSNTERHPAQPNLADPGAPHMKFLVRDIAPVLAAVKAAGAPILTSSGQPVSFVTPVGTMKALFFRDPDGYIVEAIETPAPADAAPGNLHGSIMGISVNTMDEAMKFWHDQLGWTLTGDAAFSKNPAMLDLMGLSREKNAEFRTVSGMVPGSAARVEFLEIKGVAKKPFSLRVPDPGASGMAIRVAAIGDLLERLKQNGVRVLSKDEKLVEWSATLRNVFVKDPGGINIELVGDAPK